MLLREWVGNKNNIGKIFYIGGWGELELLFFEERTNKVFVKINNRTVEDTFIITQVKYWCSGKVYKDIVVKEGGLAYDVFSERVSYILLKDVASYSRNAELFTQKTQKELAKYREACFPIPNVLGVIKKLLPYVVRQPVLDKINKELIK
jgi:hypothetical protein